MYSYPENMLIYGLSSIHSTLLKQCEKMIVHNFYSLSLLLEAFKYMRADKELLYEEYLYLSVEIMLFYRKQRYFHKNSIDEYE